MPPFHQRENTWLRNTPALVLLVVAACGERVSLGDARGDCAVPAGACPPARDASAPEVGIDAATPGNVVMGSADGTRPFPAVSTAWWIEHPDPRIAGGPVVSTVVYLFTKPVGCDKLNVPKWDEMNEPGDTLNLEIEMAWSGVVQPSAPPAIDYPTVSPGAASVPPATTAAVYYQVTPMQPPGPPSELTASGGTVTLTALVPNVNVTGTFAATFAGGHSLSGTFDAPFCPGGREP
jgi:hypothetical protein